VVTLAYVTQSTLSVDDAAKELAVRVGLVIVVGSQNSSNSNRLREVAQNLGVPAYLVDNATQIDPAWLTEKVGVGVTAGSSAPEVLVTEVVERLKTLGADAVQILNGAEEGVNFPLPKELA
jgi:4-hydroxy-3-methylbut-2-enyl diphosphate reductase